MIIKQYMVKEIYIFLPQVLYADLLGLRVRYLAYFVNVLTSDYAELVT